MDKISNPFSPGAGSPPPELAGRNATVTLPVRASLIKKGMVYSPSHGDMAFTVPLFDEFMRRAMPQFEAY